jgi:peptide/nickel transport system permease protein
LSSVAALEAEELAHDEGHFASARREAWRRFVQHRLALVGLAILLVIIVMAAFAPWIAPQGPYKVDLFAINQPPGTHHLLGTDAVGRDIWAEVVYGTRTSLAVGFGAVALAVLVGTTLGLIAGVFRGIADQGIMRVTDAFMSIPALLLAIFFVSVVGPSLTSVIFVIALTTWTQSARLVRGQVLGLRDQEFVLASQLIGVSRRRIVSDHILPNILGPLSVLATFGIASAILVEAGLSFLGLGVRPPTPSWGEMVSSAQSPVVLLTQPWIWVPPSVAIALTVLAVNLVGEGLRDAVDPRSGR